MDSRYGIDGVGRNDGSQKSEKGKMSDSEIFSEEKSRYFTRINFQETDFFYGGKALSSEKNAGLEMLSEKEGNKGNPRRDGKNRGEIRMKNNHPTVKSLELCRWLCTLSKPPDGGTVLDIFAGSMSIPIAAYQTDRKFIAIEESEDYCVIGIARLKAAMEQKKFDFEKEKK
jgi:DNA modification methylase